MVIRISGGVVRFGVPGLFLGVLLTWFLGARGPEVAAQTGADGGQAVPGGAARPAEGSRPARASASGDANGILALITSASGNAQWLYLIDTKDRAFALYRIDPTNSKGIVKLEASRQYKWDLKLEHYNNQPPEPDAIKATVDTLARTTQ
jgi:hypothetical protein